MAIVEVPDHFINGRDLMQAITRMVKGRYGSLARNVHVEGLDDSDEGYNAKLAAAYAGSPDYLKKFDLYRWENGEIVLIRAAVSD